jgi:hypothetical protein
MVPEKKLAQLIKAAEFSAERESDQSTSRGAAAKVEELLAQPSIEYLLEPHQNGFWELRVPWNVLSPFAQNLLSKAGTLSELEQEADSQVAPAPLLIRKLSDEKRNALLRITSRLSPVNHIFRAITRQALGQSAMRIPPEDTWISSLDLTELRTTYAAAVKVYEEQIYFDGIMAGIGSNRPFRLKGGLVYFLEPPRVQGILHVVAPRKEEVQALADFYAALGIIPITPVQRVFAPDEALFKPYFTVLSAVFPYVVRDEQIARAFARALDYYEEDDFQHCISTLGLIAEGYLQRIYSTLLREESVSGLTLGQTLDRIHKRIGELVNSPKAPPKSVDGVYDLIKTLDESGGVATLRPVLREIVQLIQDSRNTLGKRIDEVTKVSVRRSPFPAHVLDNLTELLKWRNAASHNSRVPLAAHEADRTLYCLVRVITWWQILLQNVDWSKTRHELLEELLEAAK